MPLLGEFGLGPGEVRVFAGSGVRRIYVVGDTDTGKTTLAGAIARRLASRVRTAIVDLDAGQASVGLPTTFAWRMWRGRKPAGLYFTGTTSPSGHLDVVVAGAAAMVAEAAGCAEKVVVDTCGLAVGGAGRALHHAVMDAVRPDVLVAIERADELSEWLEPVARSGWPRVVHAIVPACVRRRSWATRRSYRRRRFRAYFERARERRLDLREVGVLRPRPDSVGRLASLRDAAGRDVALGIVLACDSPLGTLTVLSPLPKRVRVRAVVLGSMRIARDGRQLARDV